MSNLKLQVGRAKAVVPSNTEDIYFVGSEADKVLPAVLYIGNGGDLKIETAGGDVVTFYNIQDGTFLPVNVVKVFATGTDATNILALW